VALVLTVMGGVFFGILKDPSDAPAFAGGPQAPNGAGNPPSVQAPPPAVTGDAVLDKALADLSGDNTVAWQVAADQLAKLQPNQHRAIIAQKLAERANVPDAIPRQSIIRALGVWATSKEVPVLIDALRDEHAPARQEAFRALAKTRDEQAVAPLVHCFLEGTNRFEAEQALKEVGPMAEKEMLPLLDKDREVFLRLSAIGVIKEIGTQESVPVLRAVAAEDNVHLKGPAQDALKAINARIRKGKGK
jgi:HEAT repeat protein